MSRKSFLLLIVFVLSGCGALEPLVHVPSNAGEAVVEPYDLSLYKRPIHIFDAESIDSRVDELLLEPRVERLVLLIDLTNTNGKTYREIPLNIYTLEIVRRFNETLPATGFVTEIYRVGGQQQYADTQISLSSRGERRGYINAPELIPSIGSSLEESIGNLAERLATRDGSHAIVTFSPWDSLTQRVQEAYDRLVQRFRVSSGAFISSQETPWQSVHSLDRLCIYQVGVGNRLPRSKVDNRFGCGSSEAADLIAQATDMAAFVERALYKGPSDTDKDGIFDYADLCPGTDEGRLVDFQGCLKF